MHIHLRGRGGGSSRIMVCSQHRGCKGKGADQGQADTGGWSQGSLANGGGLGLDPRAGGVGSPAVGQTKWCRPQPAHPFISAAPSSLVPPFYSVCGSIWVGLGRGRKGSVRAVCTREIFESRPAGSRSVGPLGAPAKAWDSRGCRKGLSDQAKG